MDDHDHKHDQNYLESERERRHRRIAERAYLRAASRGFVGGDPVSDWLAAEAEVDAQTKSLKRSPATRWHT